MIVSPDRWTCPTCEQTETPLDTGDDVALALAIRLVQLQHAERHDKRRAELDAYRASRGVAA